MEKKELYYSHSVFTPDMLQTNKEKLKFRLSNNIRNDIIAARHYNFRFVRIRKQNR